jgi:hypothetical protein
VTSLAARVSQGGSSSAYARKMRREIYLMTSSHTTCTPQSAYDSEMLSISHCQWQSRFWDIRMHAHTQQSAPSHSKGESVSVAGAV